MDASREFRLAWIGPRYGACAELLTNIQSVCTATHQTLSVDFHDGLDLEAVRLVDRIIIACETRPEYPWSIIQSLETSWLGIPWAVAVGPWQAGSRRSGVGVVTHWQQPWHRWWESWLGWCFPELARPQSLLSNQFAAVTTTQDFATPGADLVGHNSTDLLSESSRSRASMKRQVLLVCDCPQMAFAWQKMASHVDWSAQLATWQQVLQHAIDPGAIDVILWDDSTVACLPQVPIESCVYEQLLTIGADFPAAKLVVGLQLGHVDLWFTLKAMGVDALFIKPAFGLPLADYLYHYERY